MAQRPIAVLVLLALVPHFTGCVSTKREEIPPGDVPPAVKDQTAVNERIVGVTTLEGRVVMFDLPGARIVNDTVFGSAQTEAIAIPISEVQRVWVERKQTNVAGSIFLVVGIAVTVLAIATVIALATKESCPFIYSWDGEKYVFDAEPYGGAITQGLERDDYSELENLKADGERYRLLITNEVNETQYTNFLELWAVDHAPGTRVVVDEWGRLHTLTGPRAPVAARDEAGRDLLPWLQATDRLIWEPEAVPSPDGDQRHGVVLTFEKPPGAAEAKLVANAATGLWGSHMIRSMLELRGREVGAWYASVDGNPAAVDSLRAWNLREELYGLKVYVQEPDGWALRGALVGGGPFIAEDRVVNLDVSRVPGTELRIRIHPPGGFWALNSFAVEYGEDAPVLVDTIAPASAWDETGRDVLTLLTAIDDRYYAMPRTGDRGFLTFPATPERPGMQRTVFLHSRGHYRLHLSEEGEPDAATIAELAVPGGASRFSAAHYAEWVAAREAAAK